MITQPDKVFNARNLSPIQIAKTFIVSPAFLELISNDHALLMGPRGSGKTTLFKMLTLPALYSWDDPIAEDLKRNPPFVSVYIPSDIQWHQQLKYSEEALDFGRGFGKSVSVAAVTTNVLLALCATFRHRLRHELPNLHSTEKEATLCKGLISGWLLPPTIPYLPAIEEALESRVSQIRTIANEAYATAGKSLNGKELPKFFYLDYLPALLETITIFDHLFCQDSPLRWALCFDELELAPNWLQEKLMTEMRSTDQRLIYKLSTSPLPSFWDQTPAAPLHDFHRIPLWAYGMEERDSIFSFCDQLARSILQRNEICLSPREAFGTSLMAESGDYKEYEHGGETWELIRKAAEEDRSLSNVLIRHGISPADPAPKSVRERNQVLRKAKPIVLFRNTFAKIDEMGKVHIRSRKVADIYSGVEAIYSMSDGNPRLLIWMLDGLIKSLSGQADNTKQVSRNVQARVLTRVSRRFSALVAALPEATEEGSHITLQERLRAIGEFFSNSMLREPFSLDPKGSFIVDEDTPNVTRRLLRRAVDQGALILIDSPQSDDFSLDLAAKRCRLSYILAPAYKLPLRQYPAVRLSSILRKMMRRSHPDDPSQGRLPLEDTN